MMSFEKKYTPVKYLESTGTQYINTDIVPIYNKIEVDAIMSTNGDIGTDTGKYSLFGMWAAAQGMTSASFNFRIYKYDLGDAQYSSVLRVQLAGVSSNIKNIPLDDSVLNIKFNYESLTINGVNQNIQIGTKKDSNNTPIYIFAALSSTTGVEWLNYNCHIRCYSFKIYNDTLVRDYIPVLDKDGVPCLYDKVEDKFYYNQGTGEFLYE